jgi:hypothetical protein
MACNGFCPWIDPEDDGFALLLALKGVWKGLCHPEASIPFHYCEWTEGCETTLLHLVCCFGAAIFPRALAGVLFQGNLIGNGECK